MASKYSAYGAKPRATKELRIVMVGKTGSGKSASGNTILGREAFESVMSPASITDECSKARAKVDGQDVVVIDTPGLFDTSKDANTTRRNITQCISYACPGPHVFLIIIKLDRFTEEEMKTVQLIQELFGEAADRYSMVLFTRGDDLQGTIEEFIEKSQDLKGLVDRCHGQCHVFNNKLKTGPQVTKLLQKIRNIVKNNGGSHYTSEMFQEAERAISEEKQRILKEKEAEIRKEKEKLKREMQAEFDEKLKNVMEKQRQEREHQEREREKRERQERERQEKERQEWERRERERQEKERQEWERRERDRQEKERQEWEYRERKHQEKERQEWEHRERVRQEQHQQEWERQEKARQEWERRERERQEWEHQERERQERKRQERERQEREQMLHLQQQLQRDIESQRMEMQQREQAARWKAEKAKLEAQNERERYAREKALEERYDREARQHAEKRNPLKQLVESVVETVASPFKALGRWLGF